MNTLPTQSLIDFIESLLGSLPSSSSVKSSDAVVFSELLVDLLWTIDIELDDFHSDAKVALASAENGDVSTSADENDAAAVLARVAKAKQSAEADKTTLANLLRSLVVSASSLSAYSVKYKSG